MAKKTIKTGSIDLPEDEFKDENALIRISMMIPMTLYKDLKRLSLNEKQGGKYQLLIRDVLQEYVAKAAKKKTNKAG